MRRQRLGIAALVKEQAHQPGLHPRPKSGPLGLLGRIAIHVQAGIDPVRRVGQKGLPHPSLLGELGLLRKVPADLLVRGQRLGIAAQLLEHIPALDPRLGRQRAPRLPFAQPGQGHGPLFLVAHARRVVGVGQRLKRG